MKIFSLEKGRFLYLGDAKWIVREIGEAFGIAIRFPYIFPESWTMLLLLFIGNETYLLLVRQ